MRKGEAFLLWGGCLPRTHGQGGHRLQGRAERGLSPTAPTSRLPNWEPTTLPRWFSSPKAGEMGVHTGSTAGWVASAPSSSSSSDPETSGAAQTQLFYLYSSKQTANNHPANTSWCLAQPKASQNPHGLPHWDLGDNVPTSAPVLGWFLSGMDLGVFAKLFIPCPILQNSVLS